MVRGVCFHTSTDTAVNCNRFVHALTLTSVLGSSFSYAFFAYRPASCRMDRVRGMYPFVPLRRRARSTSFLSRLRNSRVIILSGCFFAASCRHTVGRGNYHLIYISSVRGGRCITSIIVGRALASSKLFSIRPCAGLYLKFS